MSKMTREEKKAEEARVIAEMEAAMQENETPLARENEPEPKPQKRWNMMNDATPEKIHCKRCNTLMENGVCPTCGFKIYVPMDEAKRGKIRLIVGGICVAAFLIWFVLSQIL